MTRLGKARICGSLGAYRKGPYRKKTLQQNFSTKGEAEFWKAKDEIGKSGAS
jgi:hypothetical protein